MEKKSWVTVTSVHKVEEFKGLNNLFKKDSREVLWSYDTIFVVRAANLQDPLEPLISTTESIPQ